MKSASALSWEDLNRLTPNEIDRIQGPTNAYTSLRLFNQKQDQIKVTFYRDNHAWCPYCQKIWLWLELKQIPYQIKKVTMRCYGKKEDWYLKKVPSGLLPAIEIDKRIITESDQILFILEKIFGPLGNSLEDNKIIKLRKLERQLFRSWCIWLCTPCISKSQELDRKKQFQQLAREFEQELQENNSPFLDTTSTITTKTAPGVGDIIFIPYLERMNASLAYYKGFCLRKEHPLINEWLKSLEQLQEYRGTQGDFHTHAHDLPPQMGGCWTYQNDKQKEFAEAIDNGSGMGCYEISPSLEILDRTNFKMVALSRVIKHKKKILEINPLGAELFDQALRAALTQMVTNSPCKPNKNTAEGLRYLRDRISVPRDMPLLAARELRSSLERTARLDSDKQGIPIPKRHRLDQDPFPFK